MKDSFICSICGSKNIAGPHKLKSSTTGHLVINLPGFKSAIIESYTCLDCGYTQLFIDNEISLAKIRKHGRIKSSKSNNDE